jgi:hypothetical protein
MITVFEKGLGIKNRSQEERFQRFFAELAMGTMGIPLLWAI